MLVFCVQKKAFFFLSFLDLFEINNSCKRDSNRPRWIANYLQNYLVILVLAVGL